MAARAGPLRNVIFAPQEPAMNSGKHPRTKRRLVPQAPAFEDADHGKTSTDNLYPGHDRSWKTAARLVTPQGDGKPGPVTPISGGKENTHQKRRYSTIDRYTNGKSYDPVQGRVPDENTWLATKPPGPIRKNVLQCEGGFAR